MISLGFDLKNAGEELGDTLRFDDELLLLFYIDVGDDCYFIYMRDEYVWISG